MSWCQINNLCINVRKIKELIVDFRKGIGSYPPEHIGASVVEAVLNSKYLDVHLSNDLSWENNTTSLVMETHQWLPFLRLLRRAGLENSVLRPSYRCVVEFCALASTCYTEAALLQKEKPTTYEGNVVND